MTARPFCPVCNSSDVKPVTRSSLTPQLPERDTVIAYRCANGHVFQAPEKAKLATATPN